MIYNPYIVVPLATWAIAQLAKFIIAAFNGELEFRYLYSSGGMPSVHSAVVCSLATTAFLVDGWGSHLFGFTAIFAAVVMYDSFGVRRSTGEQAAALNMIIGSLETSRVRLEQPDLHVREILGHQPKEVIVGAITGVILGGFFNFDRLGGLTSFFSTIPGHREQIVYLSIGAALLIIGILQRIILRRRVKQSAALRRVVRQFGWTTIATALVTFFTIFTVYEKASFMAWRFWPSAALAVGLISLAIIGWRVSKTLPAQLAVEAAERRRRKWFSLGKRKKKK